MQMLRLCRRCGTGHTQNHTSHTLKLPLAVGGTAEVGHQNQRQPRRGCSSRWNVWEGPRAAEAAALWACGDGAGTGGQLVLTAAATAVHGPE